MRVFCSDVVCVRILCATSLHPTLQGKNGPALTRSESEDTNRNNEIKLKISS